MNILVDADACPVKHIIVRIAQSHDIPVVMVTDVAHVINDGYSTVVIVDTQADSVDFKLMGLLSRGDIVVTQDYGLAGMVLGKGACALNQNGLIYTNDNIDRLLMQRHINKEIRRTGKRIKGPTKRTKEDDVKFEQALLMLVHELKEDV